MAIVTYASRRMVDADCCGCVGMIAWAGCPNLVWMRFYPVRTMAAAESIRQNQVMLAPETASSCAKAKSSDRTASRKTVAWRRADWMCRPGRSGISRKLRRAGKAG